MISTITITVPATKTTSTHFVVIPTQINEYVVLSRLLALAHPLEHFFSGDAAGRVAGCWEGGVPGLFGGCLSGHDVVYVLFYRMVF
jgi:hypothetical protein